MIDEKTPGKSSGGISEKLPGNTPEKIKVLIVDDSKLTRMSLRTTLNQASEDMILVGEAEEGRQALSLVNQATPDVVLMDIGMPVLDGIAATRQIRAGFPAVKVIMLTSRETEQDIVDAFRCGATSYCLKETSPETLLQIIRATAGGGCWIDPKIARYVVSLATHNGQPPEERFPDPSQPPYEALTDRERDVLKLITNGRNNQQIADDLCISLNTVKTHLKNIFQKLGVDDRTAAALKAIRERLV